MTTAAAVLLQVDAAPGLGLHEAGGEAEQALDRSVVHAGQSTAKKIGRKRRSELSAKALAMEAAYPDQRCAVDGLVRGNSPRSRAKRAAEDARFAAMPRCRCSLLLPCLDCLPEHAPEFLEQRMVRADMGGLPERTDFVHVKTSKWLAAKDAEAGRMKGGKYRPRPLLYGIKAP